MSTSSSTPAAVVPVGRPSAARERLLTTASALFYAEGLRAVGVDRVIAEAGVTRATFYRHFAGKEALVVAYLDATAGAIQAAAGDVPAGADAAAAWLHAVTDAHRAQICGPGFRGCAFINAAAEYPDPGSPVRVAVEAYRRWLRAAVAEAFARVGHPDPDGAAGRWLVLRDGSLVSGYLGDPQAAQAAFDAGLAELMRAA